MASSNNKTLFEFLATDVLPIISGLFLGFLFPSQTNLFSFPDFYIFLPSGILLLGISYYYKFIRKC